MSVRRDLSWSVNGNVYGEQRKSSDRLEARFVKARKRSSYVEALNEALLQVVSDFGTPIVMYSGGADSEMVIRQLLKLNKRPEVHFVRFDDGYNDADYRHVLDFTRDVGLKPYIHDHSIVSFLNSKQHIELGTKFHTSDVSLITTYKYAQHLGRAVMLGPELLLQKHQCDWTAHGRDEWYLIVGEHSFSEQSFKRVTGQPLIGELHYWNSDLLHATLTLPQVQDLCDNRIPGKISFSYMKNAVLEEQLGYKFTAIKKRHGYEQVYQSFRRAVNEVKAALPYVQHEVRISYSNALKQLESQ